MTKFHMNVKQDKNDEILYPTIMSVDRYERKV